MLFRQSQIVVDWVRMLVLLPYWISIIWYLRIRKMYQLSATKRSFLLLYLSVFAVLQISFMLRCIQSLFSIIKLLIGFKFFILLNRELNHGHRTSCWVDGFKSDFAISFSSSEDITGSENLLHFFQHLWINARLQGILQERVCKASWRQVFDFFLWFFVKKNFSDFWILIHFFRA